MIILKIFKTNYFIKYYNTIKIMSNIKPSRAQMSNGLRRRPKYEEISNEITPDATKIIYSDRDAKFLREDPRMTQLDGLGFFESMQEQQESINKEQRTKKRDNNARGS